MAQVPPGVSVRTVVLADCPPLTLAEIRAPATPVLCTLAAFFYPELLRIHRLRYVILALLLLLVVPRSAVRARAIAFRPEVVSVRHRVDIHSAAGPCVAGLCHIRHG